MSDPNAVPPQPPQVPGYTPPPAPAYQQPAPTYQQPAPTYAAAPGYAAAPAAAPASSPGKVLGIVGLILDFLPFLTLIGLILSIVGFVISKSAGVKNTPAKVGIILGIIFLVLGILLSVAAAIFFPIWAAQQLQAACDQLGPGEWELPNGQTITCGG